MDSGYLGVHPGFDQPGYTQAEQDVEGVRTDGTAQAHRPISFKKKSYIVAIFTRLFYLKFLFKFKFKKGLFFKQIFEYLPWFVTITLETASGTLVPAAKNVKPMTESGIFNVSPEKTNCLYFFSSNYYLIVTYGGDKPGGNIRSDSDPKDAHQKSDDVQTGVFSAVGGCQI